MSREGTAVTPELTYRIGAIDRTFAILEYILTAGRPVRRSELCSKLGMNSNSVYRVLVTLCARGYLGREESGAYRLTLKFLPFARLGLNTLEVRQKSIPYMHTLWRDFQAANVNVAVLFGDEGLRVARLDSGKIPATSSTIGQSLPVHASALGKALISEHSGS